MQKSLYLKSGQHYTDLYDLITIHRALDVVDVYQKTYQKMVKDSRNTETPLQTKNHLNRMLYNQLFYTLTGRYEEKEKTIAEWVEKDQKLQNKYDNTPPPQDIQCQCGVLMHATFKSLRTGINDKPSKMLFFFACPDCKKRKAIFENGKEWKPEPDLCPECGKEITVTSKRKGDVVTTTSACKACGYSATEIDDFSEFEAEKEKEKKKDEALLKKYRHLFCLTEEQGKAALDQREALEVASVVLKEEREKYEGQAYAEVSKLKKIKVADLKKKLIKPLEKAQYMEFSLGKPEDGMNFILPFSVQDADPNRSTRASEYELRQLIKETLKDTNWRLLSGHISYRLGYLSGRIRGYEREEDLMELYTEEQPKKPAAKITEEMKRKHANNNWVQLAKMSGEFEGIENARKRRLEKEPDGFFLEDSEGGMYTCGICGENMPGSKAWWNLDGLRCADCWRNIKEGIIPSLHSDNEDTWFTEWQTNYDYSVHPSTRKALERKGVLNGRKLKRVDGSDYCTIYLVDENENFLKKYPKKARIDVEFEFPWVEDGITVDTSS